MKRAYVYKLRPTPEQEAVLEQTLETCRRLYNHALAQRKQAWEQEGRSVGFAQQCAALPALKTENAFLPLVYSQVLQDVLHRVHHSFESFFRRVKAAEKAGYPRFKGRGWYDSFTYRQYGNGAKLTDGRLLLSKIGTLKVHADRPLEGMPKTVTVCRKADGWHASIVCDVADAPLPKTGESVGVDMGLENFATLSTGETIPNPRLLRKAERTLKSAQRRVSRRKKGSNRRRKAVRLPAKAHLAVKRARLDFAHKTARQLVLRFDTIAVEKLNIKGMMRNHPLAKSLSDAGWGVFLAVLKSKAASAAKSVVEVNPAYPSQECCGCGERVPKQLSVRWHSCPYCGVELHRDVNAALNIKRKGQGMAFVETEAVACV